MTRALLITWMLLLVPGCAGEMGPATQPPLPPDGGFWPTDDFGPQNSLWPDGLLPPQSVTDSAPPATDAAAQPTPDAFAGFPDTTPPPPPQPPGVGQPCPCSGGTVCINNVCRATCTTPSDPCKVTSNCPTTHACVQSNLGYVCMPAKAGAGQSCSASLWCPVSYICASVNSSPFTCLPVCTTGAGSPCGSGGTCIQGSGGCVFCSSQ